MKFKPPTPSKKNKFSQLEDLLRWSSWWGPCARGRGTSCRRAPPAWRCPSGSPLPARLWLRSRLPWSPPARRQSDPRPGPHSNRQVYRRGGGGKIQWTPLIIKVVLIVTVSHRILSGILFSQFFIPSDQTNTCSYFGNGSIFPCIITVSIGAPIVR